jgi:Tol biopolymer transport system component
LQLNGGKVLKTEVRQAGITVPPDSGEADENLDIYITLVKGGGAPFRLTNDPAPDTGPAWSPDGSQIAFYRKKSVFLISPLGGAERRLADVEVLDYGPFNIRAASLAWSPDGKWLAAMDQASEQYAPGATLINVFAGEKRYLTKPVPPGFPVHDTQYAFSPDGSRLAFVRMANAQVSEVFEVPVAGGEPVQLTKRNRRISGLAWVPGTRDVVFQ